MANQQYVIANGDRTDNSSFTVPGDVSSDSSFEIDQLPAGKKMHIYVHIDNGWNENVDVTLQGSHYDDSALDSPVDDGATETVNSASTGAFDSEVGHSYAQVDINPAANPTSGELTITFQAREA